MALGVQLAAYRENGSEFNGRWLRERQPEDEPHRFEADSQAFMEMTTFPDNLISCIATRSSCACP
jgi:hypothetical protein